VSHDPGSDAVSIVEPTRFLTVAFGVPGRHRPARCGPATPDGELLTSAGRALATSYLPYDPDDEQPG